MNNKKIFFLLAFTLLFSFFIAADDPIEQAQAFYDKGNYTDAIKIYMKIKQLYPNTDWYSRAMIMSARAYEKLLKYDDAVSEYKSMILKYANTSLAEEGYFSIARIRQSQGQVNAALKVYDSYLKNNPKGEYRVISLFNVACIYRDGGNTKEALKYFGQVLGDYPNETWFYSWSAIYMGDIFSGKKDYDRAIESYQRVLRTQSNQVLYSLSALRRAQAFTEKEDYATAKAIFNELIKSNSSFTEEALYGLGKSHFKLGEYEYAREIYTSVLQMYPNTVWRPNIEKGLKIMEKKIIKTRRDRKEEEDL